MVAPSWGVYWPFACKPGAYAELCETFVILGQCHTGRASPVAVRGRQTCLWEYRLRKCLKRVVGSDCAQGSRVVGCRQRHSGTPTKQKTCGGRNGPRMLCEAFRSSLRRYAVPMSILPYAPAAE